MRWWAILVTVFCSFASAQDDALTPAEIKTRWVNDFSAARTADGKHAHILRVDILRDLLAKAPQSSLDAEVNRLGAARVPNGYNPADQPEKAYDSALLEALVDKAIDEKNGVVLKTLFASNFPQQIRQAPIEFTIYQRWPEGFITIYETFATTKSAQVKKDIAICMRRAFPSVAKRFAKDAVLVPECKARFEANRERLKLNEDYPGQLLHQIQGQKAADLFVVDWTAGQK